MYIMIKGFKAFDSDMNNRFGVHFEEGAVYNVLGPVVFGNNGNGYHFCRRLEDTLRYVDGMNSNIQIAEVIGIGDIKKSSDEYYGYYDMYVASSLFIVKILSRDEIVRLGLQMPDFRSERFVKGYRLTDEEIELFKNKFSENSQVLNAIAYYQEGDHSVYERKSNHIYVKKKSKIKDSSFC